mmetsp:Transcript_81641/g.236672  ORF Transcript_81641/g.236672 Transcript_81641/m.236672 type:complete len:607 (+) Transcript_81641:115-1935(+)|eukprot:CAMPEP_0176013396 /NCGR_PEP_ID=MMETSP0120_2-20121206/6286_1 /TAXON_ID=160619 /ORGANISM="Kryptoperidinium foliaceum, Strain CCMP 1326" /LENGTH=606 /DNA_ID=CAMNT_0017346305 /DNA_START=42 /DNA_END=1862 /DNA_ORIENTATION=-
MTEVGVSLALRQQNRLLRASNEGRMKRRDSASSKPSKNKKRPSKNRQQNKGYPSSLEVFIEGASIYALCLFLPSVLGKVAHWYQSSWETNGLFRQVALRACSSAWVSGLQWCVRNTNSGNSMSVLAPDAGLSDFAIVSTLCLVMAVIRLSLVHFLVPNYNQPKRLEALVRCKSISLLSSAYPGSVTPRPSLKGKTLRLDTADILSSIPTLPNKSETPDSVVEPKNLFGAPEKRTELLDDDDDDQESLGYGADNDVGMSMDEDDEDEDYRQYASYHSDHNDDDDDDMATAPAVSAGLMSSSSAMSLQALLHQAAPMTPLPRRTHAEDDSAERMFAAPKYATACFRMLFCSVSCTIALLYFGDADFWPPAVGGRGSTKNCWDLSSIGATVMDSDFDHHNTVLRRYYLLQLSYHFHSGAFHVLAALLLWFVSSSKTNGRVQPKLFGIFPSGMWSMHNMQSLFQHCFAVGMMTFTYLFSSLRRLGAIAMFSFDFSSWFLHLLQMSINVPWNERRISPSWIKILHRLLVIPAFCYSRFYLFPFVIGYSALEESQDWLRQLENMLYPGIARDVHNVFVVCFCLLIALNVVYARRLFYHSHVREAATRRSSMR